MADAPRIIQTGPNKDSLRTGFDKFNQAIDNANEALKTANTAKTASDGAVNTANAANEKSDFTQTQLDTVTGASTIDPAVEQMKVDLEGVVHPSPDARFRSEFEKRDELLAERPTKGNIAVTDVNKNLGKFDQTYMTDEFLQQMAGTTPINSVPADKSITLEKTTFYKTGKNLFNPNKAISGYYVNNVTGALDANTSYTASGYIPVSPNTQYTRSWDGRTAFYDSNKAYISGHYDANGLTNTITTPSNCVYMRCTILNTKLSDFQVELGNTKTIYEAYKEFIGKDYVEKFFDESSVPDGSIKANKTDFATLGKNLFDKDKAISGSYVNQTDGTLGVNSLHAVSDFIPVSPSTQYSFPADSATRIAYYNENKTFISGVYPAVSPVTTPSSAKYVRYSFLATQLNTQQFEKGSSVTSYEAYGYKFLKQAGLNTSSFVPEIKLPPTIYALVGKEVNVYFQNIFNDDITKYQVDVTCSVGVHQAERWTLIPSATGTHTLTITIFKDYAAVTSASASIVIKSSTVGTGITKKILFIGDSTTNDPNYSSEVVNLFGASEPMDITLLGTRGTAPALHEGRPGWTAKMYLENADFGGVTNAFYNAGFSFSHYMTQQGYAGVDYVCINLGINDTFSFTDDTSLQSEITLILSRLQTMIDSIKAYNSNIKIGMLATIPPSYSQDAFGKSYSNGQTQWRYKRNHFLWIKAYIDYFKSKEAQGIFIVPVTTNLDTVNNMPTETVPVNSRNSATIARQNNGVHPANIGYYQMADVFYYWIKSFED